MTMNAQTLTKAASEYIKIPKTPTDNSVCNDDDGCSARRQVQMILLFLTYHRALGSNMNRGGFPVPSSADNGT